MSIFWENAIEYQEIFIFVLQFIEIVLYELLVSIIYLGLVQSFILLEISSDLLGEIVYVLFHEGEFC